MLKKVFGVFVIFAFLYSCGTNQKEAENSTEKITVENLMASIDNYIDKDLIVSGTVSHVCAHGGKRLFLIGENPDIAIKVIPNDEIGVFTKDIEGSLINIYGKVKELRIDDAYITDMEKEMSAGVESEAAHDGNHSGTETEGGIDSTQIQKIAEMRQQVAESGKGYISQYWIEATKFEVTEYVEKAETEVKEVESEK